MPNNDTPKRQYFLNTIDSKRKKIFFWCVAASMFFFFGGMVLFGFIFGFNSKGAMWQLDILMIPLLVGIYGIGYLFGGNRGGLITSGVFLLLLISAALRGSSTQQQSPSIQPETVASTSQEGWIPSATTTLSYVCENGTQFTLSFPDPQHIKVVLSDGNPQTYPANWGDSGIQVFGNQSKGYTFVNGYGTEIIATDRSQSGAGSTLCNASQ